MRYARPSVAILAFILTSALQLTAQPPDLIRRVAARELENEQARANFTYRQTVTVADVDSRGAQMGEYREVRDIIFSPSGERTEQVVQKPRDTLKRLKLTEEDFHDIREIQPMLITPDTLFLYESKTRGDEVMDNVDCWVLQVRPRQILDGQRLFDGMMWVSKDDFSVIRIEGKGVPEIFSRNRENLFPRFTTIRRKIADKYWFPVETFADDVLAFRTGAQRMRMAIHYADYKRFEVKTRIEFK